MPSSTTQDLESARTSLKVKVRRRNRTNAKTGRARPGNPHVRSSSASSPNFVRSTTKRSLFVPTSRGMNTSPLQSPYPLLLSSPTRPSLFLPSQFLLQLRAFFVALIAHSFLYRAWLPLLHTASFLACGLLLCTSACSSNHW